MRFELFTRSIDKASRQSGLKADRYGRFKTRKPPARAPVAFKMGGTETAQRRCQALILRRRAARPISPVPSSSMVAGSGTAVDAALTVMAVYLLMS